MLQSLHIFMEYKIKKEKISEYELAMKHIMMELREYEASDIQWFEATDQPNLYVEMFKVPTESHYNALKKLRQTSENSIFSKIHHMVEGGPSKIHCWAFKAKH